MRLPSFISKISLSILTFLITFLYNTSVFSQKRVEGTSYTLFSLPTKKDTIDFVIADTNLTEKKPLLLFCQGSMPRPLFINFSDGPFATSLCDFDVNEMNKFYHVVVISMPKTPVFVGRNHLNSQLCYVVDTAFQTSFSENFLRNDYLENYVYRANKVINYLAKQKFVDNQYIVVAGHSQGATVAVSIAHSNKKVKLLGLFGYNPNGRIDQMFRQTRKDAENGIITWEQADTIQNQWELMYKGALADSIREKDIGLIAWESFSKPTIHKIVRLKIPVYIAYGSNDIVADGCDLLPIHFIEFDKKNYYLKRYPNLEHSFYPMLADGIIDFEHGEWPEVMNAFIEWSKNPFFSN